ncbi:MAG: radical SAM protein [Planctomycetes bacterium]|nr:radical SAM protein [Planctomycetota bacterium]
MSLRRLSNPPNPWLGRHVEYIGEAPLVALEVYEEEARSILSENRSPDIAFRYSVNPYRGCYHACAYCYARVTHQYLDFGAGTDFDRRIVAKINAPELLREAFDRSGWRGELIAFSGSTDCYQPIEASYELTRRLLQVCVDYRNPVGIITKGILVRRDADLLAELTKTSQVSVYLSIPFVDDAMARAIEPTAPAPSARFAAIRALAEAGVRVGVAVAPMIPGLNDDQVVAILERASDCGATQAFRILLHLSDPVREVFEERLRAELPLRADRVMRALRDSRGGRVRNPTFGERFIGRGARWEAIDRLFELTCRRLGLGSREEGNAHEEAIASPTTFRRPGAWEQRELF